MELRPGYKQTEIGMIPEDWEVVQLNAIGSVKNGINKPKEAFGRGYPFVNLMDVFGVARIGKNTLLGLLMTNEKDRAVYDLRAGDVLFVRSSVKPSGVGLPTLVAENLDNTVFSGFLLRFRDNGALVRDFKEFCFHEQRFRKELIENSTVSANTNINQTALKNLRVPVPRSRAEQTAIAEALLDADVSIDLLSRLIAKKRDLRQGAMQRLLTGQTRLPGFTTSWQERRLGELAVVRGQKVLGANLSDGTPCVELEQIESGSGRLLATGNPSSTSIKNTFHQGDVLFGRLRAYLKKYWLADRQGVCSTEIWPLVSITDRATPGFIFYTVQRTEFIEAACQSYGTHMPRSDWGVVKNFAVLTPEVDEQEVIVRVLSDMDREIAALKSRLDKTRALKQAMMQALLTGRVRLPLPREVAPTAKETTYA